MRILRSVVLALGDSLVKFRINSILEHSSLNDIACAVLGSSDLGYDLVSKACFGRIIVRLYSSLEEIFDFPNIVYYEYKIEMSKIHGE